MGLVEQKGAVHFLNCSSHCGDSIAVQVLRNILNSASDPVSIDQDGAEVVAVDLEVGREQIGQRKGRQGRHRSGSHGHKISFRGLACSTYSDSGGGHDW